MDRDNSRNLESHRAARSVWDKRGWSSVTIEERLGPWIVSLAGAGLLMAGARRRSLLGVELMLAGAGLVACASAGLCNPRHASIRWRHLRTPRPDRESADLMDSFPASDPPASSAIASSATAISAAAPADL